MFYRRKIILALLEIFDGKLEKIRLQKLLFLFSQRQPKSEYDFIPYKYGCYSYSAAADLTTMVQKGLLTDEKDIITKIDRANYLKYLKEPDRNHLLEVKQLYGVMDGNALMKHTYTNYPFFAINSLKAKDLLSDRELKKVAEARPANDKTILFTIGYEGISLEEYINRLIRNSVQVLVDVRKNPLSMKYGFSKSLLKRFCENVGVQYVHFPEVGIESDQRQKLNCQKDYDDLFKRYKTDNLNKTVPVQSAIFNILKSNKRIALTCFESNICQCHRKPLAEAIAALPGFSFQIKHI
ncbi:MAG TPA: DUF488 domain-containing protein [Mucilaginibacter sp.]|jgi:uncharacterized protein (DUF488 family)|nr:DUF488 domain-containing protein [Mucilaginibacter sp.]